MMMPESVADFRVSPSGAMFSEDRRYRYLLWRCWNQDLAKAAIFIGLNPSTADETEDDPTIRRCIGFAKAWNCGGMFMLNLFAWRATSPKDLKRAADPVGPDNDQYLKTFASLIGPTVAAWGNHGAWRGRSLEVRKLIPQLQCFGLTKQGEPKHPLYLPKSAQLVPYPGGK
jgi:hypothetical protein